ncbi:MAG: hypothetical protein DMD59_01775 [Gemmatimonadetes bacterium]|nr:MAG: hypothetical protein DMD59_01775 [Gemmatimonadota bacterium]
MRSFPSATVIALTALAAVGACEKPAPKPAGVPDFHNPADPGFAQQAPDSFRARFSTTKGDFVIVVHRAWAPHGADRFYNLVRSGFYDGVRFFRVIPGFMAQFGIHGDTAVTAAWRPRVRGRAQRARPGSVSAQCRRREVSRPSVPQARHDQER